MPRTHGKPPLISTYERAKLLKEYLKDGQMKRAVDEMFPERPNDERSRIAKSVHSFLTANQMNTIKRLTEYLKGFEF